MPNAMPTGADDVVLTPNMKIADEREDDDVAEIMFANNRTVSANGFVNFPTISIGVMIGVISAFMMNGMSCG